MFRIRKVLAWVLLSQVALIAIPQGASANGSSGFSNFSPSLTYVTESPSVKVFPNVTLTSNVADYARGSITIDVDSQSATDVLELETVTTASTVNGAISVVGTTIFKGNGSVATAIGNVDGIINGQGKSLKINFENSFTNGNFSDGVATTSGTQTQLLGWTAYRERVRLGGLSTVAGWPTPTDNAMPSPSGGGDGAGASQSYTVNHRFADRSGSPSSFSVNLATSGSCNTGYCVIRGPYIVSNSAVFLKAGDNVSFWWRAAGARDAYDVYGYLLNTANGNTIQLLNQTGNSPSAQTNWAQVTTPVNADGSYKFVFVAGTWDATGGRVEGASLIIDDVTVSATVAAVTPADLQAISRLVKYRSTSLTPDLTKTFGVKTATASANDVDPSDGRSLVNLVRKIVVKGRDQVKAFGAPEPDLSRFLITKGALHSGDVLTVSGYYLEDLLSDLEPEDTYTVIMDTLTVTNPERYQVELQNGSLTVGTTFGDATRNSFSIATTTETRVNSNMSGSEILSVGYPETEVVRVRVWVEVGTVKLNSLGSVTQVPSKANPTIAAQEIWFEGRVTDVNAAINDLRYTSSASVGSDTLRLRAVFLGSDTSVTLDESTGRYYQYVDSASTWIEAYNLIESKTVVGVCNYVYNGLCGYFATSTGSVENSFLAGLIPAGKSAWLGADSALTVSDFAWVGGSPESGSALSYTNWALGEPIITGVDSLAVKMAVGGQWSALPSDSGVVTSGYFVEYGGLTQSQSVTFRPATRTIGITITARPPGLQARTLEFNDTAEDLTYGNTTNIFAIPSDGEGDITYTITGAGCQLADGVVTAIAGTGTCQVSASVTATSSFEAASTTTPLTITLKKRPLTVTADSGGNLIGQAAPVIGARISAGTLAFSDSASVTTVIPLTNEEGLYVAYPAITFSVGSANNYEVTVVTGFYGVSKNPGIAPTFDQPTKMTDGFSVRITNYNAADTYRAVVEDGTVEFGTPSGNSVPLIIKGIGTGQTRLTVTVSSRVRADASGSVVGRAKADPTIAFDLAGYANSRVDSTLQLSSRVTTNSSSKAFDFNSLTPEICEIRSGTVVLISVGTCRIEAFVESDADWNRSKVAVSAFEVAPKAPAPTPSTTPTPSATPTPSTTPTPSATATAQPTASPRPTPTQPSREPARPTPAPTPSRVAILEPTAPRERTTTVVRNVTTIAVKGSKQTVAVSKVDSGDKKSASPEASRQTQIKVGNLKKKQRIVVKVAPVNP